MAQVEMKAEKRSEIGGGGPRRLRRTGYLPGVLYGHGKEAVSINIDRRHQEKLVGALYANQIIKLVFEDEKGGSSHLAMVKEVQKNYITGEMLHIDFQAIDIDEKLTATVTIVDLGDPIGVGRDNGILEHILREIEVSCLATKLPEIIEVDVSNLEIGDTVYVKDIKLEEGVEVLTDPELSVFSVSPPIKEEEIAPEEEEAVPEVIGEEKEEVEAGSAERKEEKAAGEEEDKQK